MDFGLNVSSELSEERSSEESEVVLDPDEPVITMRIGYNLEEGLGEESMEFEDSKSEVEEASVISEVGEETEWELNERTILVTEQVEDPDTSKRAREGMQ